MVACRNFEGPYFLKDKSYWYFVSCFFVCNCYIYELQSNKSTSKDVVVQYFEVKFLVWWLACYHGHLGCIKKPWKNPGENLTQKMLDFFKCVSTCWDLILIVFSTCTWLCLHVKLLDSWFWLGSSCTKHGVRGKILKQVVSSLLHKETSEKWSNLLLFIDFVCIPCVLQMPIIW